MEHGLSWVYEEEACLRKIMLENARTRVLLCDATKFGVVSNCKLMDFSKIDCLVTDRKPEKEWIDFAEKNQVKLLYP